MGCFGKDDPCAANRAAAEVHVVPFPGHAVFRRVLAHRGHHDPVAGSYGPELDRPKQVGVSIPLQDASFVFAHEFCAFAFGDPNSSPYLRDEAPTHGALKRKED